MRGGYQDPYADSAFQRFQASQQHQQQQQPRQDWGSGWQDWQSGQTQQQRKHKHYNFPMRNLMQIPWWRKLVGPQARGLRTLLRKLINQRRNVTQEIPQSLKETHTT